MNEKKANHLTSLSKKEAKEKFKLIEFDFLISSDKTTIARYKSIPPKFQTNWLKCFLGLTTNKRMMIKAKCCECAGYENTKENVGNCDIKTCPLWNARPYQKKTKDSIVERAFSRTDNIEELAGF